MKLTAKSCLVLCALIPVLRGVAQYSAEDSAVYRGSVSHLVDLYHQNTRDQAGIFNGPQYPGYPYKFRDIHQYFMTDQTGLGYVVYEGVRYDSVSLQYDEVMNCVILQDGARRIQLLNNRLTAFGLFNINFVRLVKDTLHRQVPATNFYQLLYNGKVKLYKVEAKLSKEDVSTDKVIHYLEINRDYYVEKDGVFYTVNRKKTFGRALGDKKKEVMQYLRKNKIGFKDDKDNALINGLAYYDKITTN